jgi:hypothetical protein
MNQSTNKQMKKKWIAKTQTMRSIKDWFESECFFFAKHVEFVELRRQRRDGTGARRER